MSSELQLFLNDVTKNIYLLIYILRLVKLPEEQGYKFCKKCHRYVALENSHCNKCDTCTSKDGRTYVHCGICKRCVKPTWKHCSDCGRCCQTDHKCGEVHEFNQVSLNIIY